MLYRFFRKLTAIITHKLFIIAFSVLLQLIILMAMLVFLSEYFVLFNTILLILSIVTSIYIVNIDENPAYKLTWVMLIMALPVLGGITYILFGGHKVPKELSIRDNQAFSEFKDHVIQDEKTYQKLANDSISACKQFYYLWNCASFPVYEHSQTTYYDSGEAKWEALKEALKQAQKYIFLEYFIIAEGIMWQEILDILIQKSKEGVDVRVLYDDFGCSTTLSSDYDRFLNSLGIKCKIFNRLTPSLSVSMNNRDHRKIVVIDGQVAFSGGVNLADEYINQKVRFGHWKDSAIKIEGEAVWSFTLMFLQFWNFDEENKDDVEQFHLLKQDCQLIDDGFVLPFSDSPTDDETIGRNIHLNMINHAKSYVYITTPYLVIDYEMISALKNAAKQGIDVRIITPHIPDKKYVFAVTRSNYETLVNAGVKIYEYKPGFIHSKNVFCDDVFGVVGSVNMDYRSYYLHYECGVLMYKSKAIKDMKKDYLNTLDQCIQITKEEIKKTPWYIKAFRAVLNLFAPLF